MNVAPPRVSATAGARRAATDGEVYETAGEVGAKAADDCTPCGQTLPASSRVF